MSNEARRRKTLVCFAVKEEAQAFTKRLGSQQNVRALITGMGKANAAGVVAAALNEDRPDQVFSCGFAGGLRPDLKSGAVLFSSGAENGLVGALNASGAQLGLFYCADRVATTGEEKSQLWKSKGADAVEMESEAIHEVCRRENIPCVTVRVILDTANEDLPLDFNQLMTSQQNMNYLKLASAIARSPGKIPALIRLGNQSNAAAEKLAGVLIKVIGMRAA